MAIKVGINGFGRIGRTILRLSSGFPEIEVVGINNTNSDTEYLAYLLKYDSVHGRFDGEVEGRGNKLVVNGKEISVYGTRNPLEIPWAECGAEYII